MIDFTGVDVVVRRILRKDEICDGVAGVLSLAMTRVVVIEDLIDYPEHSQADAVCVVSLLDGDFAQVISIQCDALRLKYESSLEIAVCLCLLWRTDLLVPDESADPTSYWLVRPDEAPSKVSLDEDAFDAGCYQVGSI